MKTRLHSLFVVQALVALALNLADPQVAKADSFIPTGSMNALHCRCDATLLANGMVLVAGGLGTNNVIISSSELFNPAAGTWAFTGSMNTARNGARATLLKNGWVLVSGGSDSNGVSFSSAELYSPASGTWTPTGDLKAGAAFHSATLLTNGLVLVVGGDNAQLYNPTTGVWTFTGTPLMQHFNRHTATLLLDGTVLVTGGVHNTGTGPDYASGAELYNPTTGTWALTGPMNTLRWIDAAVLLANGSVLVAGGVEWNIQNNTSANAELYDPTTGNWTLTGALTTPRADFTMTLLASGQVLAAGGVSIHTAGLGLYLPTNNAELFNPTTLTWTPTSVTMSVPRWEHTATLLPSGKLLLAAGEFGYGATQCSSSDLYAPDSGSLEVILNPPAAVSAGAQWQVDGAAFENSGSVVTNLSIGNHTISFSAVSGWGTPSNQIVSVSANITNTVTGIYTAVPSVGAMQVTINPAGAVGAGAQWQLDGGAFQNSGVVLANVTVGDHTLSFNTVSGWITPSNQTVTIVLGATNTVAATYLPAVGALQVNLDPAGAISAGAQWQLDGGAFQSSGTILANLSVGTHTILFNTVGGWVTPENITASVAFNTTNTYSASYTIAPGAVQVPILPAEAVTAGAAWRLDGGTLQASGAIQANVSTGNHTISFVNITGWSTATNQTVFVSPGSTAVATGYYTPLDGLQVTITPSCAVVDGAQWQVDGGSFQNSGDTVTNLVPGKHIVAFNLVGGWTAPVNQTVTITAGSTSNTIGNYREASIPGTIIWINAGANQNWNNPTNWDLNRIPTNTDIVLIPHVTGTNCLLNINASIAGLQIGDCADGGSDSLDLHGQTLVVNGPITIQSSAVFSLAGGSTLLLTNTIITGTMDWESAIIAGTFMLSSNSVLNIITASNNHKMGNCLFTNYGTVNWRDDALYGGGGSPGTVFYNYGLWNAQDDRTLNTTFFGGSIVFDNFGTFRKSGGINTGQTSFSPDVTFNNTGTLDVQQGNFMLQGGGTFSGGFITTNSTGTTTLGTGSYNLNGTSTGPNLVQSGGNLAGTSVINGSLTWLSGSWIGSVTIASNSVVNLASPSNNHKMGNCLVTNYGTVNWSQDTLYAGGGSPDTVIYNYGLWNAQDDRALNTTFFGGSIVFDNFGTFRKSGGINTSQTSFSADVTFNNTGTFDVQTGIVSLQGTTSLTNGTLSFGLFNLTNFGKLVLASSATLGGSLFVSVGGSFAPNVGSQFQIVSASSRSGTFSSVNLPAGLSVNYSNNGVFLVVIGAVPVQLLTPQLVGTNFVFQFATASSQSYTVQRNDDLTTPNWIFYTNIIGSGSAFQFQVPVTITPSQRFFRVREP